MDIVLQQYYTLDIIRVNNHVISNNVYRVKYFHNK